MEMTPCLRNRPVVRMEMIKKYIKSPMTQFAVTLAKDLSNLANLLSTLADNNKKW